MASFKIINKHIQKLEPVLLGFIFYACIFTSQFLAFGYLIPLLNFRLLSFFLTAAAFNCIFLKFRNKLLAILLISFLDTLLFISLFIVYFFLFLLGRSELLIGGFSTFVLPIPFCICRVIFIKILPLKRSEDFIKLYRFSFLIFLLLLLT